MTELNIILPLIGVFAGWLLNELSARFRDRKASKQAIARALSDLLEIRHQNLTIHDTLAEFKKRYPIPDEMLPLVLPLIENLIPVTPGLEKRYNEAVDAISSYDPFLGFSLRNKELLKPIRNSLKQFISTDPEANQLLPHIDDFLMTIVEEPMNEVILEVARLHGWRSYRRAKRYLKKTPEDNKELQDYFQKYESFIVKISPEAADYFNNQLSSGSQK